MNNSSDSSELLGVSIYDKNGEETYRSTFFMCSIFSISNGSTFLKFPKHFLDLNPPHKIFFCEKDNNLYLTFKELPAPSYKVCMQKAGLNGCQTRVPFPRQLKMRWQPNKYLRANLTQQDEGVFLCELDWERPKPKPIQKPTPADEYYSTSNHSSENEYY